jgi:hypothetical protein
VRPLALLLLLSACGPGPVIVGTDTDPSTGDPGGEPTTGDPSTGPGDCCEEHGSVPGKAGLCALGEPPFCVDCHGQPVLCQNQGCATPGATDCCLSDDGETVACPAACAKLIEVSMIGEASERHIQVDSRNCVGHLTLEVASHSENGLIDDDLFLGAAGACAVYGGPDSLAVDFGGSAMTLPGDPAMDFYTLRLRLHGAPQDGVQVPLDVVPATAAIPGRAVRVTTEGDWREVPRGTLLASCDPMGV